MEKILQKYILDIIIYYRARFMASLLSDLVNNYSKGVHKIKYKFGNDDKKCKICKIKSKNCDCRL